MHHLNKFFIKKKEYSQVSVFTKTEWSQTGKVLREVSPVSTPLWYEVQSVLVFPWQEACATEPSAGRPHKGSTRKAGANSSNLSRCHRGELARRSPDQTGSGLSCAKDITAHTED